MNHSKNSKEFWNKFKILKGKNIIHTNYMKDSEGNKYFTKKNVTYLKELGETYLEYQKRKNQNSIKFILTI